MRTDRHAVKPSNEQGPLQYLRNGPAATAPARPRRDRPLKTAPVLLFWRSAPLLIAGSNLT